LLRQTHLKAIVLLKSRVRACAIRGFDEELLEPSLKVDAVPMHVPAKQAQQVLWGLPRGWHPVRRRTVVRKGEPLFVKANRRSPPRTCVNSGIDGALPGERRAGTMREIDPPRSAVRPQRPLR
jgi:hypothetical protein